MAELQDRLHLGAGSAEPFRSPDYETRSFDATRTALLALAANSPDVRRTFGRPDEVGPVRHLMGTAAGWGGLPTSEAVYASILTEGPGPREPTLADVPVDGSGPCPSTTHRATSCRTRQTSTASTA